LAPSQARRAPRSDPRPRFAAAKRAGCEMVCVGMFDEIDEGTAIFKCTDDPPGAD
jgi:hypothetical protein